MNKLLIVLSLTVLSGSLVLAGPPHVDNVTNDSRKILPEQGINNAPAWVGATNTYIQGEIVKNNSRYYMAVTAGISTNLAPIHSMGTADQTRDGVTWRVFDPRRRKGLAIVNTGTNDVSISIGYPAVGGSGIVLSAGGGNFSLANDSIQSAIYAELAVDNTNSVTSISW